MLLCLFRMKQVSITLTELAEIDGLSATISSSVFLGESFGQDAIVERADLQELPSSIKR